MCSLSVYLSQNKMVRALSFGLISCIEENLTVLIAFYSLEYSCVFFKCLFESKQDGLCLVVWVDILYRRKLDSFNCFLLIRVQLCVL